MFSLSTIALSQNAPVVTGEEGLDAFLNQINPVSGKRKLNEGQHWAEVWMKMRTNDVLPREKRRGPTTSQHILKK